MQKMCTHDDCLYRVIQMFILAQVVKQYLVKDLMRFVNFYFKVDFHWSTLILVNTDY